MAAQKGSIRERINRRQFGQPMKRALRRVLKGESYRLAAEDEKVDHATLWRAAGSIEGLRVEHLRSWRERWGDEFPTLWQRHVDRLEG